MDSLRQKLIGLINATKRKKPYRCEVEYLESTGTQYIDTGYIPKPTSSYKINFELTETTVESGKWLCVFGSVEPNNSTFTELFLPRASGGGDVNQLLAGSHNSTFIRPNYNWQENTKYFFEMTPTTVLLNGVNQGSITVDSSITCVNSIYLFARHQHNETTTYYVKAKIYSFKVLEGNTIVCDMIPVLDWDDKPALYDRITGELFYNQGESEFSYGREIHRVEYLESTEGAKQWIDTGYTVYTSTDEIELDFQFLSNTVYKWIFGDHYGTSRLAIGSGDGEAKRNLAYGTTTYKIADKYIFNTKHHYNINSTGAYIDGDKLVNYTSFNGSAALYLFSININSTSDYTTTGRIWRYKHKRNGVYLRDMYPAIDENGVGFMFDKVTHTIFDNKGTGIGFKYPPVEVEYLESTGTQYINTGLLSTANSKIDVEFSFTSMESGVPNNCAVLGGRNQPNATVNTFVLFKIASGNPQYFRFDYNGQKTVGTAEQLTWNANSKYRFQYDGVNCITTNLTTGENEITENVPASSFTEQPIYLFSVNSTGTAGNFMVGRIYKYWYTDGTNTIKLVPAIKNGKGCMYDKITGTVYANLSTDDFIVGRIKEK